MNSILRAIGESTNTKVSSHMHSAPPNQNKIFYWIVSIRWKF